MGESDSAGFVLTGGFSRRMGQDKALLPWKGRTLVEAVAAAVKEAAGRVTLIGEPERYRTLGLECLADRRPGLGPLAGIEAALWASRAEWNLVVACDMPLVPVAVLKQLVETAERAAQFDAVLAEDSEGRAQPLCAVYRRRCLQRISKSLEDGNLRLLDCVARLKAERIAVSSPLFNANTPEAWREILEREAKRT